MFSQPGAYVSSPTAKDGFPVGASVESQNGAIAIRDRIKSRFLFFISPHFPFCATIAAMESEAFEDMQKGGGALRTIKDLAAGAAGGMAQVLLGMCS